MARIIWRPLSGWPQPPTEPRDGARFKASLPDTLALLEREVALAMLRACVALGL